MIKALTNNTNNQSGSTLVLVMLVLLGVTAMSLIALHTGTVEMDVATNDKFHKMVFFAADGATEMVTELIEQNIEERGFADSTWGKVDILTGDFFSNTEDDTPENNVPSQTNHDIKLPNFGDTDVYLRVYGAPAMAAGSSNAVAAGYEGMGKSSAGGGAYVEYAIRSLANGRYQSLARIWIGWRHLI